MDTTVSTLGAARLHTSPNDVFRTSRTFYDRRLLSIVAKWRRSGETWTHHLGEETNVVIRKRGEDVRALTELPQYQKLSGTSKVLLLRLVESVHDASHVWQMTAQQQTCMVYACWCSVEWMMKQTGRQRRSVHYTLKQLETAGFLRRRHTRRHTLTFVTIPQRASICGFTGTHPDASGFTGQRGPLDVRAVALPLDVQLAAPRKSQNSPEKNLTETETRLQRATGGRTHPAVAAADTHMLKSPSPEIRAARVRVAKRLRSIGVRHVAKCGRMTNLLATGDADEQTLMDSLTVLETIATERGWTQEKTAAWIVSRGDYWHLTALNDDYDTQQNDEHDAWIYAAWRRITGCSTADGVNDC